MLGAWGLVLGAWGLGLGAWGLVLGAWCLVLGAWGLGLGRKQKEAEGGGLRAERKGEAVFGCALCSMLCALRTLPYAAVSCQGSESEGGGAGPRTSMDVSGRVTAHVPESAVLP